LDGIDYTGSGDEAHANTASVWKDVSGHNNDCALTGSYKWYSQRVGPSTNSAAIWGGTCPTTQVNIGNDYTVDSAVRFYETSGHENTYSSTYFYGARNWCKYGNASYPCPEGNSRPNTRYLLRNYVGSVNDNQMPVSGIGAGIGGGGVAWDQTSGTYPTGTLGFYVQTGGTVYADGSGIVPAVFSNNPGTVYGFGAGLGYGGVGSQKGAGNYSDPVALSPDRLAPAVLWAISVGTISQLELTL
jgi:hypothetical protein